MNPEQIRDHLAQQLDLSLELVKGSMDPFLLVPHNQWKTVCRALRDDTLLAFDYLRSMAGVDKPQEDVIEVVLHLLSYPKRHTLVVKTTTERSQPLLDSICDIWPGANWHERELYDLFGVQIQGHPDLRRIMLPEDWVGHPLRKDYQPQPFYRGIPTTITATQPAIPAGEIK